jgi:hypothetical protein
MYYSLDAAFSQVKMLKKMVKEMLKKKKINKKPCTNPPF